MRIHISSYTGWPQKNGTVDTVDFQDFAPINSYLFSPCWIERLYNNAKIIKFGCKLFILWVISYGLSFSGFARFPEFRANSYQHSTSYKEIPVPMTCLDCKSLLGNVVCKSMGNTRITEHNTRPIYGRPKLSLIVPRNSGIGQIPKMTVHKKLLIK